MSFNWKREASHLAGGIIVGCIAQGFSMAWPEYEVWIKVLIGISLFLTIGIKEIFEDNESQPRIKTIMDTLFWVSGFVLVAVF